MRERGSRDALIRDQGSGIRDQDKNKRGQDAASDGRRTERSSERRRGINAHPVIGDW